MIYFNNNLEMANITFRFKDMEIVFPPIGAVGFRFDVIGEQIGNL